MRREQRLITRDRCPAGQAGRQAGPEGAAEMQPRCSRDAAEMQRRGSRERPPAPPPLLSSAQVVSHHNGRQLHLGDSATGYTGVYERASGSFEVKRRAGAKMYSLGTFKTALEAAVVYADSLKRIGACRSLA